MRGGVAVWMVVLVLCAPVAAAPRARSPELQLLNQGDALFRTARYAEAFAIYSRAFQESRAPAFLRAMAYCRLKQLRYQQAADLFGRYQELFPREKDHAKIAAVIAQLDVILRTRVEIRSVPEGAAVYIDFQAGGSVGRTPGTWTVPPGRHVAILLAPGYVAAHAPFAAIKDMTARILVRLKPSPTADEPPAWAGPQSGTPTALLTMRTDPPEASVSIAGAHLGRAPLQRVRVPAGTHELLVQRGGEPYRASLRLPADGELVVDLILQRSRVPFYAGIAGGTLGLVTAIVFGALALKEQDNCSTLPDGTAFPQPCPLRTYSILSDIGTGLAIAGAVTAVVGYLWARPKLRHRTAAR